MDVVLARRPEVGAGGIARDDSAFQFYARINAIVAPEYSVLDLGAGRGAQFDGAASWKKAMTTLQGKVRRVAGCDVDPIVLTNPHVDDASLIGPDGKLPYEDGTFDLVYCDWVLEHVEDVEPFVGEVDRVLKPGGWFCARTPKNGATSPWQRGHCLYSSSAGCCTSLNPTGLSMTCSPSITG